MPLELSLDKRQLLGLYRTMLLIRRCEEALARAHQGGLIPGPCHTYVGQEAVATGVCAHLRPDDAVFSTHRGHGHALAKGVSAREVAAELFGKVTGCSQGRGGSMHLFKPEVGMMGTSGIVGPCILQATGAGYSFKLLNTDKVGVAFFGDGAINEGTFHESANLAGLWKLPVIFFCENNLYGEGTPLSKATPITDLAIRAESYAFPGVIVDGNDPLAVYETVQEAAGRARRGGGPTLIEAKTYRFRGHYEGDPQVYRLPGEMEEWRQRYPVPAFRKRLLDSGLFDETVLKGVEAEVQAQLEEAVAFASAAPVPEVSEAMAGVYADDHGGLVF